MSEKEEEEREVVIEKEKQCSIEHTRSRSRSRQKGKQCSIEHTRSRSRQKQVEEEGGKKKSSKGQETHACSASEEVLLHETSHAEISAKKKTSRGLKASSFISRALLEFSTDQLALCIQ